MMTRRQILQASAIAASTITPITGWALDSMMVLNQRRIPATGEKIPVIGLGTSGNFEVGLAAAERDPLREVLSRFFAAGARVIDTAPSYGTAESVLGDLLHEGAKRPTCFLASKLSSSGSEAGLAQFENSLKRLRTDRLDLLQVHNLRDWRQQLDLARALKNEGRVRYIGITHYVDSAHPEIAEVMQIAKPDFLQINYSVASPSAAKRLLPLAEDLGVAVMVNRAFEDGQLFTQAKAHALPAWAAEVGVATWAQMFLKFSISHPAVTVVIPATSKPERQTENLVAGLGANLDARQCAELIAMFA